MTPIRVTFLDQTVGYSSVLVINADHIHTIVEDVAGRSYIAVGENPQENYKVRESIEQIMAQIPAPIIPA